MDRSAALHLTTLGNPDHPIGILSSRAQFRITFFLPFLLLFAVWIGVLCCSLFLFFQCMVGFWSSMDKCNRSHSRQMAFNVFEDDLGRVKGSKGRGEAKEDV
jgi:hypothetical protein